MIRAHDRMKKELQELGVLDGLELGRFEEKMSVGGGKTEDQVQVWDGLMCRDNERSRQDGKLSLVSQEDEGKS